MEKMEKMEILAKTFLGSLLLALYRTDNITEGNIMKYWKKLHKTQHTLQDIVDFIEKDKYTELDLSKICLVSHKEGLYSPLFTGYVIYNDEKYILPIENYKYTGILEHLYENEEGVLIHYFAKNSEGKWCAVN